MIIGVKSAVKIVTQQHEQAVQKEQEEQAVFTPYWKIPIIDDDDDDEYTIQYREYLENSSNAITPDLPTEEPDNSLSMGDEHLSTIPETESDEVIKSSAKNLILSDFNDDYTSSDDKFYEDIDYVEASPPDSELVSLEEVKDDILHEKLLNINLLITKIEYLNDNPTHDCVLKSPSPFPIPIKDSVSFFEKSDTSLSYSDNSLPEFETFSDHTEETSSDSTTTHSDNSLLEYDSFLFKIKPDQEELTSVVMEDILGEPYVHMPNELPTHPTLLMIPLDPILNIEYIKDAAMVASASYLLTVLITGLHSKLFMPHLKTDLSFSGLEEFVNEAYSIVSYRLRQPDRVLVTKPHNKTPYELFLGRKPALGFMRPFGCPVTILNTIDHLGKFDGKADEGFFVGYSINSKAFRVFNSRTRIVEENMHVQFSENTPNITRSRPDWLFDIDALTKSMNYKPVVAGNQSNGNAGTKECDDVGKSRMETVPGKYYILLPLWPADLPFSQNSKSSPDAGFKPSEDNVNRTNNVNAASTNEVNAIGTKTSIELPDDPNMPELEDIVYSDDDDDVGAEADMNNLDAFMLVSPILTTRIHKDHPVEQIIRDLNSAPQTRRMTKNWAHIEVMQEELLQFKLQKVWTLVDLPHGKRVIVEKATLWTASAPRAWYETLSTYLLDNRFQKDDIIFCSTKKSLCIEFEKMMHKKFQMSSMGELTFFLGLQVKQKEDGVFISQDKYVTDILKKFGFTNVKTASTPMETQKPLLKDEYGEEVDVHLYRSMIGSLMYLTFSIPDIMFAVCQPKLGIWYPKDSPFDLVAYTDSDYARASLDRNSTTGEAEYVAASSCYGQVLWIQNQLLDYGDSNEKKLIQMIKIHTDKNVADLLTKAFDASVNVKTVNGEQQLQALVDGKKIVVTEASVRRDLQLDDEEGTDCLPNATIFEELTRMGAKTTAWNEFSSTMASAIICLAINQKFNFSKYIFESMVKNLDNAGKFLMYLRKPKEKDTQVPQSSVPSDPINVADEDSMTLKELMDFCTKLQQKVLDLENTKTAQAQEITSLKLRVKKLEKKGGSRTHKLRRLYKVGTSARVVSSYKASLGDQEDASKQGRKIDDIDADVGITLDSTHFDVDTNMFGVHDLDGDEVFVQLLEARKKHFAIKRAKEQRNKPPTRAQ
ncbi:uncharacterized mitochondrial protein-like protein [Tanacetum coccineum]